MHFLTKNTALLVIDVQEKLTPAIYEKDRMLLNTLKCIKGARLLDLPVVCTEQYPKGLGNTVAGIREALGEVPVYEKTAFSSCGSEGLLKFFKKQKVKRVLLCGIEAHVCVFQTAVELMKKDFEVIIAADAVSSRKAVDAEQALKNLEKMGATISTFECLFMAFIKDAKHPSFKEMSAVLKL